MTLRYKQFVSAIIIGYCTAAGRADPVPDHDLSQLVPSTTIICKVKISEVVELPAPAFGANFQIPTEARGDLILSLKGDPGKIIDFSYRRGLNAFPDILKAGKTYLLFATGDAPPYQLLGSIEAAPEAIPPAYGTATKDLLLAEFIAISSSKDAALRQSAMIQLGKLRDPRAVKVITPAVDDKDPDIAREAVIALYRMKTAPDAARVMQLFDPHVMDVWYQESGTPQKDAAGKPVWREQPDGRKFLQRGLPDFDYATYVREGIKFDWVRKDDHTLYVFFGIPWKVQRPPCVPELVKLLDHPDKKVRWFAIICLTHTIEDKDEPKWDTPDADDTLLLAKWRTWWKEKGPAYMRENASAATTKPAPSGP